MIILFNQDTQKQKRKQALTGSLITGIIEKCTSQENFQKNKIFITLLGQKPSQYVKTITLNTGSAMTFFQNFVEIVNLTSTG